MKNIIHICFSPSAGGGLKYAVKNKKLLEGNEVIVFRDDISQGTIENSIDIDKRIDWWKNIDQEDELCPNDSDYLRGNYNKFYKKISKIKDSDVIYLWYGECSSEICGMLYTLELLKDRITNMYLINVSDIIKESANIVYTYRAVAEVMPEDLKKFIKIKRKIELKEYDDLINQWNSLKKDNSILRIFKDDKVESVNENYFDIDILKYTEKEFKKSARIVGNIMGFSETRISDDYIFWRVKELVKSGMIEFKGKFGIMREMEIKITQKGLEYLITDSEAIAFWQNREDDLDRKTEIITEAKKQGRMEEKISIAKKLIGVLDIEIISEKTGLTVGQIRSLKIDI
ncbi:DUF1835 domain-containing protein [Clostridium peptidivorans]|uniref:DUF1835 domain-containing protein n=1 Tax=Clostridium peptidivorans TaxID=100174 RepID=UPI000BE226AE|nr:DUF1835 domain-containing protein [Clostridium peptidivorans]